MKRARPFSSDRSGNTKKRRVTKRKTYQRGQMQVYPESKYFDTTTSASFDSTGEALVPSINLVPQGVTESQRIGRKIVVTDIHFQGLVTWGVGSASTFPNSYVRMALVVDHQANGAAPTYTDVYKADGVFQFRNLANSKRFTVLKEWRLVPENSIASTSDNWASSAVDVRSSPTPVEYHKKCSIPIEFDSTTGAITEITQNNIVLLAESYFADDIHGLSANWRIRYQG